MQGEGEYRGLHRPAANVVWLTCMECALSLCLVRLAFKSVFALVHVAVAQRLLALDAAAIALIPTLTTACWSGTPRRPRPSSSLACLFV